MEHSFVYVSIFLIIGIAVIILLTAKYHIHPFFALMIACIVVGLGVQLPVPEIIGTMKDGFGNVMKSLGFIIVLGTALGILLEHTGSTTVIANHILKRTGEKNAPLAMSITGFIVGLPIFCDSGYIVLSGVNQTLAFRARIPVIVMATSLATGLYSVHCLIPPHPGAAAAAGLLAVDYGKLIMIGIIVAIPATIAGYLWAKYIGRKLNHEENKKAETEKEQSKELPSILKALLPIIVPILLIALRSFLIKDNVEYAYWISALFSLGDPVIALSIGVLLAMNCKKKWTRNSLSKLLMESAEKAGGILVIIGAGGAFGAILAATQIGRHFSESLALGSLGLFFPFLLTAVLKTAQGSSTVAIITSSSIILPLLPALGLANGNGPLLAVLSMGAGSMLISHANDAYFWVIARFSGLEMKPMLRSYSIATILMGLISILMIYLLSLFLL
jgi:gluconate:H+ symporter, GntP family